MKYSPGESGDDEGPHVWGHSLLTNFGAFAALILAGLSSYLTTSGRGAGGGE